MLADDFIATDKECGGNRRGRMKDPAAVFAALSPILRRYARGLHVVVDTADHLQVEAPARAGDPKPRFFGAVQVKAAYVSVHLMPVYDDPSLLEGISEALRKRMQGKSCFNFTRLDPALFAELDALIGRCAAVVPR